MVVSADRARDRAGSGVLHLGRAETTWLTTDPASCGHGWTAGQASVGSDALSTSGRLPRRQAGRPAVPAIGPVPRPMRGSPEYRVNPSWVVPAVLVALLAALIIGDPGRIDRQKPWLRIVTGIVIVIAFITVANLFSAARLVGDIVTNNKLFANNATGLLATGGVVWATNVIAFGLWYWELDRGGAAARAHHPNVDPAFVFPEMLHGTVAFSGYVIMTP